jgi:hypothetical protein
MDFFVDSGKMTSNPKLISRAYTSKLSIGGHRSINRLENGTSSGAGPGDGKLYDDLIWEDE